MKIAIDIGYGDVKVSTGNDVFKFTNAVAFAGAVSVDYGQSALETFTFNDVDYLVGEQALINTPFITRDYNYLYEYAPLLVYKALKMAKIKPTDEISLITGLSLKDWAKAAEFGERLTEIFVNKEHFSIKPENITVVPQGKGIYTDYKLSNPAGEDYYAVVDIGYNTFDFLVFMNGKPVPNKNYANTLGVNTLVQELQKLLSNQYNTTFSEQECKDFIRTRAVRIGAKTHDISDIVKKEVLKYAKTIANEILAKNNELLKRVQSVIISGGGAYLLEEMKVEIFDHQVFTKTPFEFSNVRGYFAEFRSNAPIKPSPTATHKETSKNSATVGV